MEITSNPIAFDGRDARLVLAKDITERLQAQEGMRRSDERFRKLFEPNTIGIVIADLTGRDPRSQSEFRADPAICYRVQNQRDERP